MSADDRITATLGFYPSDKPESSGDFAHGYGSQRVLSWPRKKQNVWRIRPTFTMDTITSALPCLRWLRHYSFKDCFPADLVAGLTVGVMAVPQSVSFAAMAGLPAAYGLYTAFVPVFAYCVVGGSRHLALGPVALVSLLLNDGLVRALPGSDVNDNPNEPEDPELQAAFNRAAIQVSLMVAVLYLVLGVLRLGFLCNLLSRPIISAFLTAGALIISSSQVKYIVGYNIPHVDRFQDIIFNLYRHSSGFRWVECTMGLAWIALLVAIKTAPRWNRRLKWVAPLGPITLAVVSIAAVWGGDLRARAGVKVVGRIQAGLPPLTVGWWLPLGSHWARLVLTAGLIGTVSLLEAISIAKALAELSGDAVDADQELLGLGVANLAGAAFSAYPSTGSFARSAVQSTAGAKTGAAGLVNAALIGLVLLCLTPVFRHMPLNALAAIVITGVAGLFDFGAVVRLYKASRMDCAVWTATFLGCLFVSIDAGLAAGVGLGLVLLFVRTAFPVVSQLSRLPGTVAYRDADIYGLQGEERMDEGVVALRVQGPMCFANAQRIKDRLLAVQDTLVGPRLRAVVLDAAAMDFVDATGLEVLRELLTGKHWRTRFVIADPSRALLDALRRGGLLQQLGPHQLFVRVHDAVAHCRACAGPATNGVAVVSEERGDCEDSLTQSLLVHESIAHV